MNKLCASLVVIGLIALFAFAMSRTNVSTPDVPTATVKQDWGLSQTTYTPIDSKTEWHVVGIRWAKRSPFYLPRPARITVNPPIVQVEWPVQSDTISVTPLHSGTCIISIVFRNQQGDRISIGYHAKVTM